MSRISPQAVFREAQVAIKQGDWETFFSCLDRNDLLRIAENSFNFLFNRAGETLPALVALCNEHSFPIETVEALRIRASEITESAKSRLNIGGATSDSATDGESQRQNSRRHRELVLNYNKCLKDGLKSVPDLAAYTAALERQMRGVAGGGSISSRLFADETLHDVVVDGKRAWATRRGKGDWTEDIGFVQKRAIWYIKLRAKRPKP
jgi:hypothetical protein